MFEKLRKGNVSGLTVSTRQLVYFGVMVIVAVSIFDGMSFTANSLADNVTTDMEEAFESFTTTWLPIIVIVIAAAVVINYLD